MEEGEESKRRINEEIEHMNSPPFCESVVSDDGGEKTGTIEIVANYFEKGSEKMELSKGDSEVTVVSNPETDKEEEDTAGKMGKAIDAFKQEVLVGVRGGRGAAWVVGAMVDCSRMRR